MPRVPGYESQGQARALPVVYENTARAPAAYGGDIGTGLRQAGASLQGIAGDVSEDSVRADNARAMGAYADLEPWKKTNVYDASTGALSARGENAIGIADTKLADFDKVVEKVASGLANDRQRQRFRELVSRERESIGVELSRHERTQVREVERAKAQAFLETTISNAANRYALVGEDGSVALNRDQLAKERALGEEAVLLDASNNGMVAVAGKLLAQYRTQFHAAVLNRMNNADQGELAEAYFKEFGSEIEPKERDTIEKIVGAKATKSKALREADRIEKAAPDDLDGQLALASAIADPEMRTAVEDRVTRTYGLRQKAKDDREDEIFGRVVQQIEADGGKLDQTSQWFQLLSEKGKGRAMEKAGAVERQKRATTTEERQLQKAANDQAIALFHALEPEDQIRLNIATAPGFEQVDQTTAYRIQALQKRARKDVEKGQIPARTEFREMVAANTKGMSKPDAKLFQQHMDGWRARWYEEHEDKAPTREEVRKGIAEETRLVHEQRFFGLIDTEVPTFKAKPKPKNPPAAPKPDAKPTLQERARQLKDMGYTPKAAQAILNKEGY